MDDTTASEAGTRMQDRIGMDLTILPEMHIFVEDTAGVERAAMADETARSNNNPGTHMHPRPQPGGRIDDGAGVHPGRGPGTGIKGPKGFGETQARVG
jgi:hypothetical protein